MQKQLMNIHTMASDFLNGQTDTQSADNQSSSSKAYNVEQGTSKYRDFVLDNVLHSETEGDIHYNVYIPEDYDGQKVMHYL